MQLYIKWWYFFHSKDSQEHFTNFCENVQAFPHFLQSHSCGINFLIINPELSEQNILYCWCSENAPHIVEVFSFAVKYKTTPTVWGKNKLPVIEVHPFPSRGVGHNINSYIKYANFTANVTPFRFCWRAGINNMPRQFILSSFFARTFYFLSLKSMTIYSQFMIKF